MIKNTSKNLLVSDPLARWMMLASLGISLSIFYWLIELRTAAIDITFERIFHGLFIFYDYPLVIVSVLILLLALVPQVRGAGVVAADSIDRHIHAVAALYFLLLAAGAFFIYHAHPLSMDEYAPVLQSKVFAAGELTGRFPPQLVDWLVPKIFQNYFLSVSHVDGRIVSSYWPGFALLLAPFSAIGAPWLCNPLLGALGLLCVHRLAAVLFESRTSAGIAAALTLAAPAFAINAISFYSMNAHLLLNGVFMLLLLRPTQGRAFAAGLVGSLALCLHNPVPHALFAAPWVIWMVVRPDLRRMLPALIGGYIPLSVLLGIGWTLLVRDVSTEVGQALPSGGPLVTARLSEVIRWPSPFILHARLIGLAKLWLWAVPASLVVALFGLWRWRQSIHIRLLALSAALTLIGYLFVPFDQGHGWGFRYFHSAWLAIPLLAAAAVTPARNAVALAAERLEGLRAYVCACSLLAVLLSLPLSAYQVEDFISTHLAQRLTGTDSGVIISRPAPGYYAYDLIQNDPFLREPVVRMDSQGREADERMMRENFPGLQAVSADLRGSVWISAAERSLQSTTVGH